MNNSSEEKPSCYSFPLVMAMIGSWLVCSFLLLPLFLYVFYVGYKQWQKQQSVLSHSDVFTFTIIIMEILTMVAASFYSAGFQDRNLQFKDTGSDLFAIGMTGQMFIHAFTCVDRYLAVVHPITYLHLKKRGGVMIRNISIASVWLFIIVFVGLRHIPSIDSLYYLKCMLVLGFLPVNLVAFCSISVLCVLIRPGPGEGGRDSRRVNQLKRRAFFTIIIILGILMIRSVYFCVSYLLATLGIVNRYDSCWVTTAVSFFLLPSSVVLPLMFLHKARRLPQGCIINKRKR